MVYYYSAGGDNHIETRVVIQPEAVKNTIYDHIT
jgi:hypothetical protein